jgi:hypothetical protein
MIDNRYHSDVIDLGSVLYFFYWDKADARIMAYVGVIVAYDAAPIAYDAMTIAYVRVAV